MATRQHDVLNGMPSIPMPPGADILARLHLDLYWLSSTNDDDNEAGELRSDITSPFLEVNLVRG